MKRHTATGISASTSRSRFYRLIPPLAVGLVLRVWLLVSMPGSITEAAERLLDMAPDTRSHLSAATNLAEGNGLYVYGHRGQEVPSANTLTPYTTFPPAFSSFLATALLAGGTKGPLLIVTLQILISLASIVVLYALLSRLISPVAGALGAWFLALIPDGIALSLKVLTETLYVFLLSLWFLLLWLWSKRRASWKWAVALGLLAGVLLLCRTVTAYSIWLIPIALLIGFRHVIPMRRLVISAVLFLLTCQGVASVWRARNLHHFGHFSMNARHGEHLLFNAVVVLDEAWAHDSDFARYAYVIKRRWAHQHPELNAFELDQMLGAEAKRIIREHPVAYMLAHVRGALRLLVVGPFSDVAQLRGKPYVGTNVTTAFLQWRNAEDVLDALARLSDRYIQVAYALLMLSFHGFVVAGAPRALRGHRAMTGFGLVCLCWVIPLYTLAGPAAVYRYRYSVIPALLYLAALGFVGFRSWLNRFNRVRPRH